MSRRSSSAAGGGVSLFPFLSILACLIGILTLMIKIISDMKASENHGRDKEELARAEKFQSLQHDITKSRRELEKLKASLKSRNSAQSQLQELEEKRIVLRKQLADSQAAIPKESDDAMQKKVELMLAQIAALKKERPALEKKLEELRAELARRKIKPDTKAIPVVIQPGGTGGSRNTKLFFVECNGTGLVILDKGAKTQVSTASITTDPALAAYLNKAKVDPNSMVLFLIRNNGASAYPVAAGFAESQFKLRTGKLPVPTQGEIDLSLFSR